MNALRTLALDAYGFPAPKNVLQNTMANVSGRSSDHDHDKFLSQPFSGRFYLTNGNIY
jgi:hypothetical protein